ncbi:hypothetical protein FGB62_29g125 [Gracilaria domingensis]|nr:hypothetical protein FGB62_29g125 [Gracilaria domingensis]
MKVESAPEKLRQCLETSLRSAHKAVLEGARVATRKYGIRDRNGDGPQKIKLWMLQRPLDNDTDSLIHELETVVCKLLREKVDVDEFRRETMRKLRCVEATYVCTGNKWFRGESSFKIPSTFPVGTESLIRKSFYTSQDVGDCSTPELILGYMN